MRIRMPLNVIQTFVWLRMALFGEMTFCVDFKYERNLFRPSRREQNVTKYGKNWKNFYFGPTRLYCFVNYLFCCWRRSPMRLFHKWWRLCIFFTFSRRIVHVTLIFLPLVFSHSTTAVSIWSDRQRSTQHTTQCNTIFSFWQLFSNDVFRWNLISSARKIQHSIKNPISIAKS